ncbi:MAG: hypothetical protein M0C28_11515 [Candidatus Moduliflexus flocculans]|nr:hypothetical protein [Candidatus Moduliflexus flocculans]
MLWGPNSLVPQWKDVTDIYEHMKFFLGKGPRPQFDRYTYWEKFDYMAVFWGMFIIGGSGLLLWFADELSRLRCRAGCSTSPRWCTAHEALLAVGFIFTIHFFNGHLRPEKFPMDMVIFTGRITEHELKRGAAARVRAAACARAGWRRSRRRRRRARRSCCSAGVVGGTALVLGIAHDRSLMLYSLFWMPDECGGSRVAERPDRAGPSGPACFRYGAGGDRRSRR